MTERSPQVLANSLPGVVTGDRIQPPSADKARKGKWAPLTALPIEKWPRGRLAAFDLLAPMALYIAAPERPVSVALLAREGDHVWPEEWVGGDPATWAGATNRPKGCWPVRLGLSAWQKDTVTRALDRDPYVKWALRWRLWVLDEHGAPERLLAEIGAGLRAAAEEAGYAPLRNGYINAGPHFSPYRFQKQFVEPVARELGAKVWSEGELGQFLVKAMQRAVATGVGRHERLFRQMCLDMVAEEVEQAHALRPVKSTCERVAGSPSRGYQLRRMDPDTARMVEEAVIERQG